MLTSMTFLEIILQVPNGFKAQFYNMSEILTPVLAWGFFGPDEQLNTLMNYFKDQVMILFV